MFVKRFRRFERETRSRVSRMAALIPDRKTFSAQQKLSTMSRSIIGKVPAG